MSVIDTAVAVLHGRFNSVTENPSDCPMLEATKQHFASRTFVQHAILTAALVKMLTFLDTSDANAAALADLSAARSNAVQAATAAVAAAAKLGAAPSNQEDEPASPVNASGGRGEASAASPQEAHDNRGSSLGNMRGAPAPTAMPSDAPQQLAAAAAAAPAAVTGVTATAAAAAAAAAAAVQECASAAATVGTPPTTAVNGPMQTAEEQPTAAAAAAVASPAAAVNGSKQMADEEAVNGSKQMADEQPPAAATIAGKPPAAAVNGNKQTVVDKPPAAPAATVDLSWQPGLATVAGNVLGYRFVPNAFLRPEGMSANASTLSIMTSSGLYRVVQKDPLYLIRLMRCFPVGHECTCAWIETMLGKQRTWTTQRQNDFKKLLTPVAKRLKAEYHIWKAAADAKHAEDSSDSDNDTLDTHVKRSAAALADAEPAQKKPRPADTSPPG